MIIPSVNIGSGDLKYYNYAPLFACALFDAGTGLWAQRKSSALD